jgi:hypothetical protein
MWIIANHMTDTANNPLLKFLKRYLRATDGLRGNAFWVNETDPKTVKVKRFATPLVPGPGAGVHRQQDLLGGHHRQDPGLDLTERDLRPDRQRCAGVVLEDARAARSRCGRMTPPIVQHQRGATHPLR